MGQAEAFFERGWVAFPHDRTVARWVDGARQVADRLIEDPEISARWTRCGGTWFAGVNVFPNDRLGGIEGEVPALSGPAIDFVRSELGLSGFDWDRAQISVCFEGYPRPSEDESDANFRYRLNRDAAHVDGLLRDKDRRRRPSETHGFVLGLPLGTADPLAAPLVVWEGSHEIMREAFRKRLDAGIQPEDWRRQDVTDAYVAARKACFETCKRTVVTAQPGEAYLVHRLALHGVAPWTSARSGSRAIAYFRPDPYPNAPMTWWLDRP